MTKRNKHHGSTLESYLAEEGLLEEAQFLAAKKVIAAQIAREMERKGLAKSALAQRMNTTRAQLDPDNDSVTLATLKRAAAALGKTLRLELA